MPIKYCTQAARPSLRISSPLDPAALPPRAAVHRRLLPAIVLPGTARAQRAPCPLPTAHRGASAAVASAPISPSATWPAAAAPPPRPPTAPPRRLARRSPTTAPIARRVGSRPRDGPAPTAWWPTRARGVRAVPPTPRRWAVPTVAVGGGAAAAVPPAGPCAVAGGSRRRHDQRPGSRLRHVVDAGTARVRVCLSASGDSAAVGRDAAQVGTVFWVNALSRAGIA